MEKKPGRKAMDLFDKYGSGLLDRREFLDGWPSSPEGRQRRARF